MNYIYYHRPLFLFEQPLYHNKNDLNAHLEKEHSMCLFCRQNVLIHHSCTLICGIIIGLAPTALVGLNSDTTRMRRTKASRKSAHSYVPFVTRWKRLFLRMVYSPTTCGVHGKSISNKVGLGQFWTKGMKLRSTLISERGR